MKKKLKDIKKIIDINKDNFNDEKKLIYFIESYLYDNKDIEDLEDDLHEYADRLVPIYYHDIVSEWTENGDCRGLAEDEGLIEDTKDPYKIMQSDLYCYYYQELSQDYFKLLELEEDEDYGTYNDHLIEIDQ